jgi:adenylate kinase family enzyme
MARVWVVGTSGSGKTTLGRQIADTLDVPFLELDCVRHQPGWVPLPDDEFRTRVAGFAAGAEWVTDGNYLDQVGDILSARATEVVWVDPPRWMVMTQVIWRSASRAISRKPLWNGNKERLSSWLQPDHPIRWAWTTFESRRERLGRAMQEGEVPWTRLRGRDEAVRYLVERDRQRHL